MNRNSVPSHMGFDPVGDATRHYRKSITRGKAWSGLLKVTSKGASILHKKTPIKNPGVLFSNLPEALGYAPERALNGEDDMRVQRCADLLNRCSVRKSLPRIWAMSLWQSGFVSIFCKEKSLHVFSNLVCSVSLILIPVRWSGNRFLAEVKLGLKLQLCYLITSWNSTKFSSWIFTQQKQFSIRLLYGSPEEINDERKNYFRQREIMSVAENSFGLHERSFQKHSTTVLQLVKNLCSNYGYRSWSILR